MSTAVVEAVELGKSFGGLRATDSVSLAMHKGEVHALIGPNGAGKSTLINQLTGELSPDSGRILIHGRDVTRQGVAGRARAGLARSYQITSLFLDFSVLDNVAIAAQSALPHSFRFFGDARRDEGLRRPAREILERMALAARADVPAAELSYGEQRQLELAMVLATRPQALLLDEPTAGMAHEESAAIIRLLGGLKRDHAILLVEHDMNAVFALADRISVLVYGRIVATGAPDEIRGNAEVRRAYLGERGPVRRARPPGSRDV